jgi:hypothetical protein
VSTGFDADTKAMRRDLGLSPWPRGFLIECTCLKCQRGGTCRVMRRWRAEWAAEDRRAEQVVCLTDEDRAWLTAHGWDGR